MCHAWVLPDQSAMIGQPGVRLRSVSYCPWRQRDSAESVENYFVCLAQPTDEATKRLHQIEETEKTSFIPSV